MARTTISGGDGDGGHPRHVYGPRTARGAVGDLPPRSTQHATIRTQGNAPIDSIRAGSALGTSQVPTMMGGGHSPRFVHSAPISTVSMKGGARTAGANPVSHDSVRSGALAHARASVLPTLPGGAHMLTGFVIHQPPIKVESHSVSSLAQQHQAPHGGGNVMSLDAGKTVINVVGVNDLKNGPHQR